MTVVARSLRMTSRVAIATAIAMGAGCAAVELTSHSSSNPVPRARVHSYVDGGKALYYTLDIGTAFPALAYDTHVFVIAGSDCASMGPWLPQYFRGLNGVSGSLRIEIIHKRFIEERTSKRPAGCSEAFTRADHPSRWISDYVAFIEARLAQYRPRRIVLVGISEGGEVVPALAHRIAGVSHLVLLASGGMDPMEAFKVQADRYALDGVEPIYAVTGGIGGAPVDPDAPQEALGGRSWRYWSELRSLEPTAHLTALEIPILVAMAREDRLMPFDAALRIRDLFAALGKRNLTLLTYDDADHALFDHVRGLSRLPEFWREVDLWLAR